MRSSGRAFASRLPVLDLRRAIVTTREQIGYLGGRAEARHEKYFVRDIPTVAVCLLVVPYSDAHARTCVRHVGLFARVLEVRVGKSPNALAAGDAEPISKVRRQRETKSAR